VAVSAIRLSRRSREASIRNRRVLGQPLSVVGILVARQAAIDGLAKEIRQGELAVASDAGNMMKTASPILFYTIASRSLFDKH